MQLAQFGNSNAVSAPGFNVAIAFNNSTALANGTGCLGCWSLGPGLGTLAVATNNSYARADSYGGAPFATAIADNHSTANAGGATAIAIGGNNNTATAYGGTPGKCFVSSYAQAGPGDNNTATADFGGTAIARGGDQNVTDTGPCG